MDKIMIINNDLDTMSLLKTWLEKKNYDVQFTGDIENVLNIVKSFRPSLLLVDVMHGDIINVIKKDQVTHLYPILLMTGYTLRKNKRGLPVDDVIEKPFNLDLLDKKVKKLISNYNSGSQRDL